MQYHEIVDPSSQESAYIDNPFPSSKVKDVMFNASPAGSSFDKFRRDDSGVWFAETRNWGVRIYGADRVTKPCYIDVRNPYFPTRDEVEEYYGEMDIIGDFFNELKAQGYDAYVQGGESGTIAVFDTVSIVNALTGEAM